MTRRFDAFVMFAEMRTGSNHLEESLNRLSDIACHGEVFNPVFIGRKDRVEFMGYDMARREREPLGLLQTLIARTEGLAGFRFFHDHDPRVLDTVLPDPRVAKVILTRDPVDAYVSRKIAAATGQWRLTDLRHARTARIRFDESEFADMLAAWQRFRDRLRRDLQRTGQTAFEIRYEDINDVDVLNGLARFLGSSERLAAPSGRLKRQNPQPLPQKVENHAEMAAALARLGLAARSEVQTEAARGPGVASFVAHPDAGLLFLPMAGAVTGPVIDWMGRVGGVGRDALLTGMTQKELRRWLRGHAGFVSFSVLRHPAPRAFAAFRRLARPAPDMAETRRILEERYGLAFPPPDHPGQREAFVAFLDFLKGNLAGQTGLPTPPAWASQLAVLQAAAQVLLPARIMREDETEEELARIAAAKGLPLPSGVAQPHRGLAALHDDEVEAKVRDVYRRDYVHFGFAPWTAP